MFAASWRRTGPAAKRRKSGRIPCRRLAGAGASRAGRKNGKTVPVNVCVEAGYNGFWLARFPLARGIETAMRASAWRAKRRQASSSHSRVAKQLAHSAALRRTRGMP
jgi:hypothetical protein